MKISLTLDEQPRDFLRRQPPEAKRALREALHAVEAGELSPEPLEGELDGYYKLKAAAIGWCWRRYPAKPARATA